MISSTPAMYLVETTTPSSSLVTSSPVPALHLLLFHLNTTPAY